MHGDDFVVEGEQSDLEWVRDELAAKYLLTVRGILGPEPCDQKSIFILVRAVEWRADELWWEADPRHVEKNLEVCGMTSGNPSALPGVKVSEEEGDDQPLVGEELARYRFVAATANFIAQDRPDVKFAVKELCRNMAKPTFTSWRKMKKLARYFKGQPRVVQKIKFDVVGIGLEVNVIVDSDWAGCASTRKSAIGGCIMVGDICVKAWSTTQKVVALRSGEAEYYAAVKGASEGSVSWQVALTWVFGWTGRCRSECPPTAARAKEFVRGQGLAGSDTSMLRFSCFSIWFEKSASR